MIKNKSIVLYAILFLFFKSVDGLTQDTDPPDTGGESKSEKKYSDPYHKGCPFEVNDSRVLNNNKQSLALFEQVRDKAQKCLGPKASTSSINALSEAINKLKKERQSFAWCDRYEAIINDNLKWDLYQLKIGNRNATKVLQECSSGKRVEDIKVFFEGIESNDKRNTVFNQFDDKIYALFPELLSKLFVQYAFAQDDETTTTTTTITPSTTLTGTDSGIINRSLSDMEKCVAEVYANKMSQTVSECSGPNIKKKPKSSSDVDLQMKALNESLKAVLQQVTSKDGCDPKVVAKSLLPTFMQATTALGVANNKGVDAVVIGLMGEMVTSIIQKVTHNDPLSKELQDLQDEKFVKNLKCVYLETKKLKCETSWQDKVDKSVLTNLACIQNRFDDTDLGRIHNTLMRDINQALALLKDRKSNFDPDAGIPLQSGIKSASLTTSLSAILDILKKSDAKKLKINPALDKNPMIAKGDQLLEQLKKMSELNVKINQDKELRKDSDVMEYRKLKDEVFSKSYDFLPTLLNQATEIIAKEIDQAQKDKLLKEYKQAQRDRNYQKEDQLKKKINSLGGNLNRFNLAENARKLREELLKKLTESRSIDSSFNELKKNHDRQILFFKRSIQDDLEKTYQNNINSFSQRICGGNGREKSFIVLEETLKNCYLLSELHYRPALRSYLGGGGDLIQSNQSDDVKFYSKYCKAFMCDDPISARNSAEFEKYTCSKVSGGSSSVKNHMEQLKKSFVKTGKFCGKPWGSLESGLNDKSYFKKCQK